MSIFNKKKTIPEHYLFDQRALVLLFIPLLVEQFLNMLVGLADSIMIASVGEAAMSGVSLVDNCFNLLIQLFFACATGGAVVAGQYLGRKEKENACKTTNQIVLFMVMISLVVMVLVYLGRNLIINGIFGQIESDVEMNARLYMMIVTASIPFLALYSAGAALFRSMGDSKTPMKVSLLMNGINVAGNAILIYGFHRGAEGVAIPTLASRIVSAVVVLTLLRNPSLTVHFPKKFSLRLNGRMIRSILVVALPNGIENSMFHVGKIALLSLVSTMGTYSIAANAVGNALSGFMVLAGCAAQLAIVAVVSQCIGAGDYEQAKYYVKRIHAFAYVGILISGIVLFIFMPWILKIYNLSPEATDLTWKVMIVMAVGAITVWPFSFVMPCVLRSSGDGKYTMATALITMFAVRVALSYGLNAWFHWGLLSVWISSILDQGVRCVLYVKRYRSGKWMSKTVIRG